MVMDQSTPKERKAKSFDVSAMHKKPFCNDAGTMATNGDDLNLYDAVHNSFKKIEIDIGLSCW